MQRADDEVIDEIRKLLITPIADACPALVPTREWLELIWGVGQRPISLYRVVSKCKIPGNFLARGRFPEPYCEDRLRLLKRNLVLIVRADDLYPGIVEVESGGRVFRLLESEWRPFCNTHLQLRKGEEPI